MFEIRHVPNRQDIEIHHGNTTKDTRGCVLVGMRFGTLCGERAVLDSDLAFARLMTACHGTDSFPLQIIDVEGTLEVLA